MARASVLVVDGDIEALELVRTVLSSAGYTVEVAMNGRKAPERAVASPTDVLITETLIEDRDGIELISAVKRAHLDSRIIAITARRFFGALDLLDLAGKLGADAVFEKLLKTDTLLANVARLAELKARLD